MDKILGEYTITGKKRLTKRTVAVKKKPLKKRHVTYPSGPGKSYRKGISLIELFELFPDENTAREWFEGIRWADGRYCPYCKSEDTKRVSKEKPMPYWCKDCHAYFSVKTGTLMERSPIPLQKWLIAFYLVTTNLKGVSSMKLHRDLKITQKTAWFMFHRIRTGMDEFTTMVAKGPVEVDESHLGGKEKNKHAKKKLHQDWPSGKTTVVGIKDRQTNRIRAEVIEHADRPTLHEFVKVHTEPETAIYTDEHRGYSGLENHETVNHSVGQYVEGMVHTNGMESFWAVLKRAIVGTFHKMSKKHLPRYVNEFSGRHNIRSMDTIDQMALLAWAMIGKRLQYKDLIK